MIIVTIPAVLAAPTLVLLVAPIDDTTSWPMTMMRVLAGVALAVIAWAVVVVPFGAYRRINSAELAELRSGDLWHFTQSPLPTPDGWLTLEVARCRWSSRTYVREGIKKRLWPVRVVCVFAGEPRSRWRWVNVGGSRAQYLYILDASGLPTNTYRRDDALAMTTDFRARVVWEGGRRL